MEEKTREEQEKAEKLAAAKKRFEQLKKQKGKGVKAGTSKKKDEKTSTQTTEPAAEQSVQESTGLEDDGDSQIVDEASPKEHSNSVEQKLPSVSSDSKEKAFHGRQPSVSLQSKMRSASFRRTSLSQGPLSPNANGMRAPDPSIASPDGDYVTSVHRTQATQLEELERENKRLVQEAESVQRRLQKTEQELDELREANGQVAELKSKAQRLELQSEELSNAKQENASLQRQLSQLQSQSTKRHVSSPSQANAPTTLISLQSQLDSKSSTIESMEMEISNLRSKLDKSSTSTSSQSEQVKALEEKLERAERAAGNAQRELVDVKKNLARANDKALTEGTQKTSAETKIRNLISEADDARRSNEESLKRIETLEKKLQAIANVNKDADVRRQASERERERLEKEAIKFHRRLASLENENLHLREDRSKNKMRHVQGTDDDALDELEDAEKRKLEIRIRDLESEIFELRRGVWRERRRSIQPGIDGEEATSPTGRFDDIDLNGPSPYRRPSNTGITGSRLTTALSSGFSALTGGGNQDIEELDDDAFDESAFQKAQQEEAMERIERVKEIKRGLKDWQGWRMDIVDLRRANGGGVGEIFEV